MTTRRHALRRRYGRSGGHADIPYRGYRLRVHRAGRDYEVYVMNESLSLLGSSDPIERRAIEKAKRVADAMKVGF